MPRRACVQEYFHLGWLTCAQCTSSLTSHSADRIHWWINSLRASKGSQKMKVKNWTCFKKSHYIKIGHSDRLQIIDFQKCEMSSSPIFKKCVFPYLLHILLVLESMSSVRKDSVLTFPQDNADTFNLFDPGLCQCKHDAFVLAQCNSFISETAKWIWTAINIKVMQLF